MYNIGQTAVFLRDLIDREYPAIAEIKRNKRVNGQREISLSFLYTEINKDFMDKLEFGWKVLFKGEWYTITHPGYSTDGDFFAIEVTAILSFFVDLNGYYLQDKVEDKSSTPAAYFSNLFQGTPYSYVLASNLAANTLSYQDNQSKTERFLYGIDRFNAEYKVQDKVAYIHDQIGSDKDVILHEDLNVNSVKIDVDASGFHTWAKGYGDLPEDDIDGEYQLEVVYVSPLAEKYGMIEGPAIKNGNFKDADALTDAVKNQVENSYIVSTEIEAVDLTNNGYPEMVFEEGDRNWLYVSRLNLNQQVRVMEIEEYFDWEGNIIDARYTVGNEGIATRYKTQQYDTIKDFKDILSGRKKLNYDWMPDAIRRAAEIINGNQDSLFRYGAGEIIGINQSNPNGYMRFNTDGIGFSRDGGKTYKSAMTYEGVVAESIVGSHIIGVNLSSADEKGVFHVTGANAEFIDITNNRTVQINPDGIISRNEDDTVRFEMNRYIVRSNALAAYDANVYLAPRGEINEVRVVNEAEIEGGSGEIEDYTYKDIRAKNLIGNGLYANYRKGVTHIELRPAYERGEVRIYKGDASTSPADIRLSGVYGHFFNINGQIGDVANIYIRPYEEVRITRSETTDEYVDMRLDGIYASHLTLNGHINQNNLYVRAFGEVRATAVDSTEVYIPLRASEFNNGSSITYKTNIEDISVSGLEVIKNLEVKQYVLQSDVDNGIYYNWQVGLISELSPEVATHDLRAVNLNKWLGYLTKAVQELSQLEDRIADLEMVV